MKKLVRDAIADIEAVREEYDVYFANQHEYRRLLIDKLREEVAEFIADWEAGNNAHHEAGDVLEVLIAMTQVNGSRWGDVEAARIDKATRKGVFARRVVIVSKLEKAP
jgi:predicted house-cleaning noncanonical NTP pyrophosphatase (MazG superfamily)